MSWELPRSSIESLTSVNAVAAPSEMSPTIEGQRPPREVSACQRIVNCVLQLAPAVRTLHQALGGRLFSVSQLVVCGELWERRCQAVDSCPRCKPGGERQREMVLRRLTGCLGDECCVCFQGLRNSARVWMFSMKQPPSAVVLVCELLSITPRDFTQ